MRFDYGRVKALFMCRFATTRRVHRVNAYIRKPSKLCIVGETCFRQSPDASGDPSGKVRDAIQEDPI